MPFAHRPSAVLALAAALLSVSLPASAAFTGAFAPANWTPFTQTLGCGSSTIDVSGMPNTLVLRTLTGCANIAASYTLTGNIPATGSLSFDWSYTSNSPAGTRIASYTLNGVTTNLATGLGPANGTVTIPVTAGQPFQFTLQGGTNASLTITNFNAPQPPAPPPGPAAIPTLGEWARIGLAGLLGLLAWGTLRRQRR